MLIWVHISPANQGTAWPNIRKKQIMCRNNYATAFFTKSSYMLDISLHDFSIGYTESLCLRLPTQTKGEGGGSSILSPRMSTVACGDGSESPACHCRCRYAAFYLQFTAS